MEAKMNLEKNLVHSLVETLLNVSSLAGIDFFVVFKDQSFRRFAGSDSLTNQFLDHQLTPFPSDIKIQRSAVPNLEEISLEHQSNQLQSYAERDPHALHFFGENDEDVKIGIKKEDEERDSMEEDFFSENFQSVFTKKDNMGLSLSDERTSLIPKISEKTFSNESENPQNYDILNFMHNFRNEASELIESKDDPEDLLRPQIFKCSHCPKSFKERTKLKSHLQSHARDKPFNCLQCPKSFKKVSQIRYHILTHSGEKPVLYPTTRAILTLRQKIDIIDFIEGGRKQVEAVKHFSLHRATIHTIWKQKEKLKNDFRHNRNPDAKRIKKSPFLIVEEPLIKWIQRLQENIPLSGPIVQEKAIEIGKELGLQNFEATSGWLSRFKKRNSISF